MKVTVDAVVFGYVEGVLNVLLIKRKYDPFKSMLALPGGYILETERARETVIRELKEETNVDVDYLEQLYTFSKVDRDPRGRTITIAYYALVNPSKFTIVANSDADAVEWVALTSLKKNNLAFDHFGIIEYAITRLRIKIRYEPIGFDLLPKDFTLSQLHRLYSTVIGFEIDRRNFIKQAKKMDFIVGLKKYDSNSKRGVKGELHRFDEKKYQKAKKNGINFWL
jgi:8-oxo-dGTP diphosphatase